MSVLYSYRRKRSMGEDMKLSKEKGIKMGSAELSRLWNINPDNMKACTDVSRCVQDRLLKNYYIDID